MNFIEPISLMLTLVGTVIALGAAFMFKSVEWSTFGIVIAIIGSCSDHVVRHSVTK